MEQRDISGNEQSVGDPAGRGFPVYGIKLLGVARQEIAQWKNFDYLLISTSMEEDLRRMLAIVDAEKMRTARARAPEF